MPAFIMFARHRLEPRPVCAAAAAREARRGSSGGNPAMMPSSIQARLKFSPSR